MENENKVVGNATDSNVGNVNQNVEGKKVENNPVDYKSFDKLLGQLKKAKQQNEELSGRLQSFEKERVEREERKLAEQGEFKKLLEMKEEKLKQMQEQLGVAEEEKKSVYQTLSDAQKLQAVYDKLPGKLKNQKYMSFIDIDSVVLNPETNEIDTESVDLVVNHFMEEHKDLVDTSHVGRLPGDAPSNSSTPIYKRFKDLSLKDMKKNVPEAVRQARKELGV